MENSIPFTKEYKSFEEFEKAVEIYINYYNNERIQAKTKWMPPVSCEPLFPLTAYS